MNRKKTVAPDKERPNVSHKRLDLFPGGEVEFKYIFNEDYNPEYVSGFLGGRTARGEVIINFFFERPGLPNKETYKIKDDGTLGDDVPEKTKPENLHQSLIRQIKSGVILSQASAKELRNLLDQIIESE
mgnify:CR=1 FL=1